MSIIAMLDRAQKLMPLEAYARVTGKSYWRLRYRDGRVIDEREVDWSLAPTQGRMALQLVCPNGKIAQLGSTIAADGRLFQLKCGIRSPAGAGRTDAHLIGIVTGTDGRCSVAAWEYGPGRLVAFEDNVFDLKYQHVGRLAFDHLGIRPD